MKKNSLRKFCEKVGLSPLEMTFIENGINASTMESYVCNNIEELEPMKNERDRLFCRVRKIQISAVYRAILNNYELGERIKSVGDMVLTTEQLKLAEELFKSFDNTSYK